VAARDFADLVDAIGKLIAAILDMNDGVGVWKVAPVDIGPFGRYTTNRVGNSRKTPG
jgi:hypothetical protein